MRPNSITKMILKCLNMKTFKKWHASIIINIEDMKGHGDFFKKMFVVLADMAKYSINPEINGCLKTMLCPSEMLQGDGCVRGGNIHIPRRVSAPPASLADNENIPEASW